MGKGELKTFLRAWKGKLVSLKAEVDWTVTHVLDGLEKLGPEVKTNRVGHNKKGKKRARKSKPSHVIITMWPVQ